MDLIEFEVLKKKLAKQGRLKLKIASGSMEPLLMVNEVIEIRQKAEKKKFEIFDLAVYLFQDQLRCHFVWRDQREYNKAIVTRSLKEPFSDEQMVYDSHILGWVGTKKISWFTKVKIIFLSVLLRRN